MSNLYLYFLFAVVATAINLLVQNTLNYFAASIYVQILFGTTAGLIGKFLLDKKYVFKDSKINVAGSFLLYSLFGALLTPLWWVIELAFVFYFGTLLAQNIGAFIGLTICYYLKYLLDKKYVFIAKD